MAARHGWLLFGGLWTILLGLKLWLAATLPLFGDEAFYWLESRHPAPAYDDVPGLTAWLIALGTAVFGSSTLAVRLPFIVLGALSALWLARLAGDALGQRFGGWAGLVALLLPLFALNGLLALPDVPLTLAVLGCAEALRRLRLSAGRHGHVLLAAALVLGWLSHYRFVVPFVAGGLWLLLDPCARPLLRQPRLWFAGLLGCALGLAPLVSQQLATGGGGFAFQFDQRHPWQFQIEGLLDPLLQAAAVTPGLLVVLVAAGWTLARRQALGAARALLGCGLAIVLLFLLLAPFVDTERSRVHWPLPGWLLLAALTPAAFVQWSSAARRAAVAAGGLAALVVAAACGWLALAALTPERLAASRVYPHNFVGWPEIGARVGQELAALPDDTLLAADNFMLAAQLSFALGGRPVYSLDHPLNAKHGRAGELRRFGLDEQALLTRMRERPVLLVLDQGATRLRQRPAWMARVCERFPAAQPRFDIAVHHGRKRFIAYLQQPGASAACAPPPLGHLDAPRFGAQVDGALYVHGWAIRDRVGIDRLWLTLDGERLAELRYGLPMPGVQALFPSSDDPAHPRVGFDARLRLPRPAGRYWLAVEAESADGLRSTLVSVPIDWRP